MFQLDFIHPQLVGIHTDVAHILSNQALTQNITNFAFLEHIARAIQHLGTRSYLQDLTSYHTTVSKKPIPTDNIDNIHDLPLRQAKTIYNATNLLDHLLQKDFGKSQSDMIVLQNMDLQLLAIKERLATNPDSTYEL